MPKARDLMTAPAGAGKAPDGWHDNAVLVEITLARTPNGQPATNPRNGKNQVDAIFSVPGATNTLRRRINVTTKKAQSSDTASLYSSLIATVTGLDVSNEHAIGDVDTDSIRNAPISIFTQNKANGYCDVEKWRPAPANGQRYDKYGQLVAIAQAPPAREWTPDQQDVGHRGRSNANASAPTPAATPPPVDNTAKLAVARQSIPAADPRSQGPTRLQALWIARFVQVFELPAPHVATLVRNVSRTSSGGATDRVELLSSPEAAQLCKNLIEHVAAIGASSRRAS